MCINYKSLRQGWLFRVIQSLINLMNGRIGTQYKRGIRKESGNLNLKGKALYIITAAILMLFGHHM